MNCDGTAWKSSDGTSRHFSPARYQAEHCRNQILAGRSDIVTLAAFERFLEIMREAPRHLPDEWKGFHPAIPWRSIADLGNQIRHEYFRVQPDVLWAIYANDLDPFERAIDALLAAHDK